ncbi:hypothetical protein F5J12DRAFT_940411 [Pisolithus orientalis]|uniref:uncharacterized protein n=1 Tax=Pisolithus orientalis TaxID=936130 RepID=UPI002224F7CA|nr:uncharacterized protein F5J12DRAFT_940411 [Pisolithus orientalis]KAI5983563.1 hypothetical protein F5J12DRAFT_940411 [Pisolithus orientalis]
MSPMGGSQDADNDINPFLSEPIIWPTPTVWSDISLSTAAMLTRTHGLAPSLALDRLGFKATESFITINNTSKIVPPSDMSLITCPESPTPCHATSSPLQGHDQPSPLPSQENMLSVKTDGHDGDGNDSLYTCGRLPATTIDEFNEGFQQVNKIFSKLGESQGMPWQQVKDCYNHQYSHSNMQNLWNVYSVYFAKNPESELAQLPQGDHTIKGSPSIDIRKQCYACFKEVYSENYIDILETWKESEELQDLGGTVSQCQQLFNKSMKNLDHIFTRLSKAHGIEGMYMLAGKIVNQDVGLAHAFTTAGAKGFFCSHCHADTNEIIRHFKAHIYNKVSLDSLAEVFKDYTKEAKEVVACRGKGKQCAVNFKKDQSDDEVKIIENIKQHLRKLIKNFGFKWASQKLFPWKSLPNQLAGSALVMYNWPADVILPVKANSASSTTPKIKKTKLKKATPARGDVKKGNLAAINTSDSIEEVPVAKPGTSTTTSGMQLDSEMDIDNGEVERNGAEDSDSDYAQEPLSFCQTLLGCPMAFSTTYLMLLELSGGNSAHSHNTPGVKGNSFRALKLVMPAARSLDTCDATNLFTGQGDGPTAPSDMDFFSHCMSNTTTGLGSLIPQPSHLEPPAIYVNPLMTSQAERPRPHVVQGGTHSGDEPEPFNLQHWAFPKLDEPGLSGKCPSTVSAKLLAAKEGHLPTIKGEADGPQGSDHSGHSNLTLISSLGLECHHGRCWVHRMITTLAYMEGGTTIQRLLTILHIPHPILPTMARMQIPGASHIPSTNNTGHPNYGAQHAAVAHGPGYHFGGNVHHDLAPP